MRAMVCVAAAALVALGSERVGHAQSGCALRGTPVMEKSAVVFSAAQGGEVIARFSGQPVAVAATLPTAAGDRVAVRTGKGTGGFRVEGFLEARAVPVMGSRSLPVVADHVWIGAGRRLTLVSSTATHAVVELKVGAPIDQTVRATAPCDALVLDPPTVAAVSPPGKARGYLARRAPLELLGAPGGASVFTLSSDSIKDALLFWGTERRSGFVHVQLASDVLLDGWLPVAGLEALKEGEMLDALGAPPPRVSTPQLMLQGEPRRVKVTREVP
ncbi:MAG: hypothetical protein EOO75_10020, partial [Myxococcales bacterium]